MWHRACECENGTPTNKTLWKFSGHCLLAWEPGYGGGTRLSKMFLISGVGAFDAKGWGSKSSFPSLESSLADIDSEVLQSGFGVNFLFWSGEFRKSAGEFLEFFPRFFPVNCSALFLQGFSDLFWTRVWCIPGFGAENKGSLFQDFLLLSAILRARERFQNPAPNPGMHQTPVETSPRKFCTVSRLACQFATLYLFHAPTRRRGFPGGLFGANWGIWGGGGAK